MTVLRRQLENITTSEQVEVDLSEAHSGRRAGCARASGRRRRGRRDLRGDSSCVTGGTRETEGFGEGSRRGPPASRAMRTAPPNTFADEHTVLDVDGMVPPPAVSASGHFDDGIGTCGALRGLRPRRLRAADMDECVRLHRRLFPIEYERRFYDAAVSETENVVTLGAFEPTESGGHRAATTPARLVAAVTARVPARLEDEDKPVRRFLRRDARFVAVSKAYSLIKDKAAREAHDKSETKRKDEERQKRHAAGDFKRQRSKAPAPLTQAQASYVERLRKMMKKEGLRWLPHRDVPQSTTDYLSSIQQGVPAWVSARAAINAQNSSLRLSLIHI